MKKLWFILFLMPLVSFGQDHSAPQLACEHYPASNDCRAFSLKCLGGYALKLNGHTVREFLNTNINITPPVGVPNAHMTVEVIQGFGTLAATNPRLACDLHFSSVLNALMISS